METTHQLYYHDSTRMVDIPDQSVDLVVTSPPYPMIEMWDELFFRQDPRIPKFLEKGLPLKAFQAMHQGLDPVWAEVFRVLKPGGIAAVNIGDAVRTIGGDFALYPNHARIQSRLMDLGLMPLPTILWRKTTNAPNKFMGSGMLPPGAYVTLEHEYILMARKGAKMPFVGDDAKRNRSQSAFFWEERNQWFSDVWFDVIGTRQELGNKDLRKRSAAFPFELVYRLIHMFSVQGAVVLDPFLGTGTTTLAAMASGRNSRGYELEAAFFQGLQDQVAALPVLAARRLKDRLDAHQKFVADHPDGSKGFKYVNEHYGFPVKTNQERAIRLPRLLEVVPAGLHRFEARYDFPVRVEPEAQTGNLTLPFD
jgi:DNA modification methylase